MRIMEMNAKIARDPNNSTLLELELKPAMIEEMGKVDQVYSYFGLIEIISIFNFSFFVEHICTWAFTHKIGRSYTFPRLLHFTDLLMVFCSISVLL